MPRITVGLPVYKGANLIAKCLECLQQQTFGDFEAIISVDGGDAETAEACRPFLVDPRFRMVVQSERLDWHGNFNWLLQQNLQEFFCYRQHDDTTAPDFFEVLLQTADNESTAAAVYCDCQYTGGSNHIEIAPSIEGDSLNRMLQYIERLPATPVRGLIRRPAIRQAGLLRFDEFRGASEVFVWLAKLGRWGNLRRVAKPLYYKFEHDQNYTNQWRGWAENRKRGAWTTMFTGLLEAAMPLCHTSQERRFFQQTIFDRIIVYPNYLYRSNNESNSSEKLIAECMERLRHEGNTHLLSAEEFPPILQGLQARLGGIELLERSRMRRFVYQIRQRFRLGRLVYPGSRIRRGIYQIHELFEMLRYQMSKLS